MSSCSAAVSVTEIEIVAESVSLTIHRSKLENIVGIVIMWQLTEASTAITLL